MSSSFEEEGGSEDLVVEESHVPQRALVPTPKYAPPSLRHFGPRSVRVIVPVARERRIHDTFSQDDRQRGLSRLKSHARRLPDSVLNWKHPVESTHSLASPKLRCTGSAESTDGL
jgi:hypothetical protein